MSSPVAELKDRLKLAISTRGIKPIELSEKTGIPKSAISQYMSGYAKPKQDRIYLICNALSISEAWLMGYDVPMEKSGSVMKTIRFDEKIDDTPLNRALNKLNINDNDFTEDEIKDIVQFVEFIKNKKTKLHILPNAAHEIIGASDKEKEHDNDIMNNDDFWK